MLILLLADLVAKNLLSNLDYVGYLAEIYFCTMTTEYIIFMLALLHIIVGFGWVFWKIFKKPSK